MYFGNPDLSDLNFSEKEAYNDWFTKFRDVKCYPVVGKLVVFAEGGEEKKERERVWSPEEINACRGVKAGGASAPDDGGVPSIYVGCGNFVFDTSFGGVEFYGPGGPYHQFAGMDASRALALMSFEQKDKDEKGLEGLGDKERKVLADWVKMFKNKKQYPVVGRTGQEFSFQGCNE